MKRITALISLLVLVAAGPAQAGFRLDCASPGSWLGHVVAAVKKLASGTFEASLPDLTKEAISGDFKADNLGGGFTIVGQTLAAHVNPMALVDLGAAVVCYPSDSDGVTP